MFTQEEKDFISKVFSQLTISAANPEAIQTAQLVQSILSKLTPQDDRPTDN